MWSNSSNLRQPLSGEHVNRRAMLTKLVAFGSVLLVAVAMIGCGKSKGTVLGTAPTGAPRNVLAVRAGDTPASVTLQGTLIEKCPVAGCWFYLQDNTGTIKIDTKDAGFVVVNVPLQTQVTVAGKIVTEGDELTIAATGLRY